MSGGLIALLDDVAAIAKVAAASLDDVASQAARAGAKSAGVVIDDAAVTPRYVVGFAPSRELPIVAKIAIGSARNKLLILLPVALVLSLVAPLLITPLLMLGGTYLCFEGAEKIHEALLPRRAHQHDASAGTAAPDPQALEEKRVASAVRTDLVLSAEIMFIALATIPDLGFWSQAIVLALVGLGITTLVYGAVAILVKADDVGLALARFDAPTLLGRLARCVGRGLVVGMPSVLKSLAVVGTAAMLWVGGGILVHGLTSFGVDSVEQTIHDAAHRVAMNAPALPAVAGWLVSALAAAAVGLAVGGAVIPLVNHVLEPTIHWARALLRDGG